MSAQERFSETEFGYFDVDAHEYVITTHATPSPWINYLGLEGEFCGIVSNTAGGPTWRRDPLYQRITRYIQVGPWKDKPGRYLYLRDRDSGEFWSASYQPVTQSPPEQYECRHGLGYTRIASLKSDIHAEMLHFIPLGVDLEIQRVALRNEGAEPRRLSAFTYREFVNGTADNDLVNCQYSMHIAQVERDEQDERILYVTTPQQVERPLPFYAISQHPVGFDTRCATFFGDGSAANPQVVREGRCRDSLAGDDTAVGVYQLDLELEPGEERIFHVVLGMAQDPAAAQDVLKRWLGRDGKALAALQELKEHAVELLAALHCDVPDPYMQLMVNTWNAYQCWINFLFSRSISGRDNGIGRSMGTRDSLQDLLGYMHIAPERARERIVEMVNAVHLQDGSCRHQYNALTKEGSESKGYSDDHLWLPLAVCAYVKESGDYTVLDEQISYSDNRELTEDLYHHLLRAIRFSANDLGPHGLPRLRAADWNDCIGDSAHDEVSESVLVGIMLVKMAREMIPLTRRDGRADLTVQHGGREVGVLDFFTACIESMTETLNREAWLEQAGYYARGTDGQGAWFGVPEREEAKMFLEPQPWAVMAGVADPERGRRAMDMVAEKLATPYGVQILAPACAIAPSGDFHAFPKGAKENGGIFCHPNPWAMCAETILGRGDRAFDYYRRILPPAASEPNPAHYSAEPYVYGQQRYGREHREYGKCAGTWLTGTAAWNYVAATQYILGVRADWDGLRVEPCIPADWDGICVVRRFRGATYHIDVANPDGVCRGVRAVTVDGEPIEGNVLPAFADGKVHEVRVTMG